MIYLGLRNTEKQKIIIDYIRQNDIRHVVIFSGEIGGQIGKKSVRAPSRAFHLDIEEIGSHPVSVRGRCSKFRIRQDD